VEVSVKVGIMEFGLYQFQPLLFVIDVLAITVAFFGTMVPICCQMVFV